MVKISPHYAKVSPSYLFSEIGKRTKAFQDANPQARIYRLGIGNTTEAIPQTIIQGLRNGVERLANVATYTGYGDEQGNADLRKALAEHYAKRKISIDPNEIFVSDGAKCDVANIQSLFDQDTLVAVQDPAYPVYVDTNVIAGRTGRFADGRYTGMIYMPCTQKNGFIPLVPNTMRAAELIYLCSPNNPTGAVMDRKSLEGFVGYAQANRSVIIFDAAYATFIADPALPRSIYEIDGAKECAIEINSFSKICGFTGVRLGWSIVPKALIAEDAPAGVLHSMWNRRQTTFFNGASNIAQAGGLAALTEEGIRESNELVQYYMENARIIREGLEKKGLNVFGGTNAPYLWMENPHGMSSWDFFDKILQEAHVVTTPGSGFGPAGEGYTRLSAFGHRENVVAAVKNIEEKLKV
ncbi:MAG: LL-diaminopimelate aminotransferase [Nanoarchaeota archaeon]